MYKEEEEEIEKIAKNKSVFLLYKNDEELKRGCIVFNHDGEESIKDLFFQSLANIKLVNLTKNFYVLIKENTNLDFFERLIKKLSARSYSVTFYCTDFIEEQMTILEKIVKNKCLILGYRKNTYTSGNLSYNIFTTKNKSCNVQFKVIHIDVTVLKLFSIKERFINDFETNNIPLSELESEQIKQNENQKHCIAGHIFKFIQENEEFIYNSPVIYNSLQSLIRAKYFNNLDFQTIYSQNFSNINYNKIEMPMDLPLSNTRFNKKNCCTIN